MSRVGVVLTKESLEPDRLLDQVVVVIDILFATSTIVHAFAEGVDCIVPACDFAEASRLAERGGCLTAGEYLTEPLPGFAPATPLALAAHPLRGTDLVYCTTNGTVALRRADRAHSVYAGALLNAAFLVEHIVRVHPGRPVLLVCAGSAGRFNLEDFYGAGHLVGHFARHPQYECSDAATAAMLLCNAEDPCGMLLRSRVGRLMQERGLEAEVRYAARRDTLDIVPRLRDGRLERSAA